MKKFGIEGDSSVRYLVDRMINDLVDSKLTQLTLSFTDWHNNLYFEYQTIVAILDSKLSNANNTYSFDLKVDRDRARMSAVLYLVIQFEWGCTLASSKLPEDLFFSIHDTVIFVEAEYLPTFCKWLGDELD